MAKKFSSEMSSRGTVKVTDRLIIQNIDTGAVEYTTVADLLGSLTLYKDGDNVKILSSAAVLNIQVSSAGTGISPINRRIKFSDYLNVESGSIVVPDMRFDTLATNMHFFVRGNDGNLLEVLRLLSGGGVYAIDNVSAASFTDRTPHYEGDALEELKQVKGIDGKIDHSTLPAFARVTKKVPQYKEKKVKGKTELIQTGEKEIEERDLGAMISILTKALQQQIEINENLTKRIEKLENK